MHSWRKPEMVLRRKFISAKDLYLLAMATGLEGAGADVERRAPTLKAMKSAFRQMVEAEKALAVQTLATRLVEMGPKREARTTEILHRKGYHLEKGRLLAGDAFDAMELSFVPADAAAELRRGLESLGRNEESAAIGYACGAVDLVTGAIYEKHGIGDPGRASFSTKVNTSLQRLNIFPEMERQFVAIGIDPGEATQARNHLEAATNNAAQALQILRKRMGNVHGSRPALRNTAYDCLKLAAAICGLFEGKI